MNRTIAILTILSASIGSAFPQSERTSAGPRSVAESGRNGAGIPTAAAPAPPPTTGGTRQGRVRPSPPPPASAGVPKPGGKFFPVGPPPPRGFPPPGTVAPGGSPADSVNTLNLPGNAVSTKNLPGSVPVGLDFPPVYPVVPPMVVPGTIPPPYGYGPGAIPPHGPHDGLWYVEGGFGPVQMENVARLASALDRPEIEEVTDQDRLQMSALLNSSVQGNRPSQAVMRRLSDSLLAIGTNDIGGGYCNQLATDVSLLLNCGKFSPLEIQNIMVRVNGTLQTAGVNPQLVQGLMQDLGAAVGEVQGDGAFDQRK